MRLKSHLILALILSLVLIVGCQPGISQPKFSTSFETGATPIPLSTIKPAIVVELSGRIRSFDVSPDGKTIAIATSNGVALYDLESYKLLRALNNTVNVFKISWSPDGEKLAVASLVMQTSEFGKAQITVWDTSDWRKIFEQTGNDDTQTAIYGAIAWSPNSRLLASNIVGTQGVLVYDIQSGKIISHQDMLWSYSISWSPDGSRLVATGDLAYGIRRWIVSTDKAVRLFDQRASSSMQIAWSPDGKRIASGHAEGTVCFWTVVTNKCDGFIKAHQTAVFSLAWSPDGKQLATGGGIIRIWDSKTGRLVKSFGFNDKAIYSHLEWLPNNRQLVSVEAGYADTALTTIHFWDVATGNVLFEFQGASGNFGE